MNAQTTLPPIPGLTRRRKAAMLVQMMISDGSPVSLSQLPEPLQEVLTRELGAIRLVDRDTVKRVAQEFVQEVDAIGLSATGTEDGALLALADHLSPALAARLQQQSQAKQNGDRWPFVVGLPVERLVDIMMSESIEVGAITLSKLNVTKAAEVLSQTPGDRARRISLAMSRTEKTSPEAVFMIGVSLAEEYSKVEALAFEKAPVQRLGAILNATPAERRDDLLESLGTADPDFAGHVRKAIFTFKDIVERVKPLDVPNCIRIVPPETLTQAIAAGLSGPEPIKASAEFVLANLSQRMATQIREDVEELGPVKKADAETAMTAVTSAIRTLVDEGAITLIDPDEDAEDA